MAICINCMAIWLATLGDGRAVTLALLAATRSRLPTPEQAPTHADARERAGLVSMVRLS